MKKHISISIRMTVVMIVICCVFYFGFVYAIGKATDGGGSGKKLVLNNKVVGYSLIGQKFTDDKYFWGRPSTVEYNAAGSAGSNKGPSNPDYLQMVRDRIDTFLVHNPGIKKEDIPAEMVMASGSGLDPHISPESAVIQIPRISSERSISKESLNQFVKQHTHKPVFGPTVVHVLELNIALDQLR